MLKFSMGFQHGGSRLPDFAMLGMSLLQLENIQRERQEAAAKSKGPLSPLPIPYGRDTRTTAQRIGLNSAPQQHGLVTADVMHAVPLPATRPSRRITASLVCSIAA